MQTWTVLVENSLNFSQDASQNLFPVEDMNPIFLFDMDINQSIRELQIHCNNPPKWNPIPIYMFCPQNDLQNINCLKHKTV